MKKITTTGSSANFLSQNSNGQGYRVLQTIQIELILLCVLAEPAVLGSAKSALKFKNENAISKRILTNFDLKY